ncbi:hypothetical protein B0G76_1731 [Paraburkholderia sp. BL23I1N1]|uniref:hypothetical protein n=1 Tax=unclassified Paraburkholderia TaxID=2615204 RepID=UPI000B225B8E|nr:MULTISPECIES: hypothetical protein [unclassified Paraburkholderia]RKE35616.1 hypothetical protein B0G76_1731 [Paraburkholderia sp. BL23I1N1]
MSRKSSSRSRPPLGKSMLLPLPVARIRSLSLEHHLALETITSGHGNVDLLVCLLKAVYTAWYLREEIPASAGSRPFQHAEAALERCIARAERGEAWEMLDADKSAIEKVLLLHDKQLATVPAHRFLMALDSLNHFAVGGLKSPIPPLTCTDQH